MAKQKNLQKLTAQIIAAYVQNHQVSPAQLPELIKQVHQTFAGLQDQETVTLNANHPPAVSIQDSVSDNYMTCLEDGLKFRSLKRHLKASHGLTPEQYREKWQLPASYPMVAPNYSLTRSRLARKSGLGRPEDDAT